MTFNNNGALAKLLIAVVSLLGAGLLSLGGFVLKSTYDANANHEQRLLSIERDRDERGPLIRRGLQDLLLLEARITALEKERTR